MSCFAATTGSTLFELTEDYTAALHALEEAQQTKNITYPGPLFNPEYNTTDEEPKYEYCFEQHKQFETATSVDKYRPRLQQNKSKSKPCLWCKTSAKRKKISGWEFLGSKYVTAYFCNEDCLRFTLLHRTISAAQYIKLFGTTQEEYIRLFDEALLHRDARQAVEHDSLWKSNIVYSSGYISDSEEYASVVE